jgi:hypothetical protein
METNNDKNTLIAIKGLLIGEQLSSITFVHDYLQVSFDGRVLTAYVFPEVIFNNVHFSYKKGGYRDALCSLIAEIVSDILLVEDASLTIVFSSGNKLVFIIAPNSIQYEKLILTKENEIDYIWD